MSSWPSPSRRWHLEIILVIPSRHPMLDRLFW